MSRQPREDIVRHDVFPPALRPVDPDPDARPPCTGEAVHVQGRVDALDAVVAAVARLPLPHPYGAEIFLEVVVHNHQAHVSRLLQLLVALQGIGPGVGYEAAADVHQRRTLQQRVLVAARALAFLLAELLRCEGRLPLRGRTAYNGFL